ncbi:unnamed protein product [Cyclocybe aegerita]|uniref:Transposase n=1 Tax=Cyclocybe aegerita TaxID=1973307 RepID=A0A8S0VS29_CYCAE|nr:unnamed protein product [Cyclocybe aegerita]
MKLLFLAALLSAAVANAAINDPCSVGSIPGICITTSSCTNAGGTYASGYCPNDPSNVRCCHKTCGGGGRCRFTSTCPTGKIQREPHPPKTSRHEVDTPTRNRIISYAQASGNAAAAGRNENVNERTAQCIYKHFLETGETSNKPRPGPSEKLSDYGKRQVIREVIKHRRMPLTEITNRLATCVSPSTIRRIIAAQGFHQRVARKVPYLSPAHKRKRLNWARIHQSFWPSDWRCTMFSDECYVYLGDDRGRIYVTRRPDEELLEECLVPTFKQSTVRVMVWGCIAEDWKGPLVVLEYPGGKGGERGNMTFQQDGAPSHGSKVMKRWFAQHGIPLFPHPPSSPDLNPIEPIWHLLKSTLRHLPYPPTTVDGLRVAVLRAWEGISVEVINHQIGKMDRRVKAVLAARGGHTGF